MYLSPQHWQNVPFESGRWTPFSAIFLDHHFDLMLLGCSPNSRFLLLPLLPRLLAGQLVTVSDRRHFLCHQVISTCVNFYKRKNIFWWCAFALCLRAGWRTTRSQILLNTLGLLWCFCIIWVRWASFARFSDQFWSCILLCDIFCCFFHNSTSFHFALTHHTL